MIRIFVAALLAVVAGTLCAHAQQPPVRVLTNQTKVTIAVTNTFQQLFATALASSRSGCTIQNLGTHTMFVFFGTAAPADTTTSFQIAAQQTIGCGASGAGVLTDNVWLTGTANDVAITASQ